MELNWIADFFSYNSWANQRLFPYLDKEICEKQLPIAFDSILGQLLHMHYYDVKTYNRILEKDKFIWNEERECSVLLASMNDLSQRWIIWFEKNACLPTSKEIVSHLLSLHSHNIHHRSQIFNALCMLGLSPESLDIYLYQKDQDKA